MSRRVLIDADDCPVVDEAVLLAKRFGEPCLILCDAAHRFEKPGAQTLVFSKGADSVDFALVNLVRPGDIVVTQDYGLAAMCLARDARSVRTAWITPPATSTACFLRGTPRRKSAAGRSSQGPKKRAPEQDKAFEIALIRLLGEG